MSSKEFEAALEAERKASGNDREEPYASLDEMHDHNPVAPGANPFSAAASHDPEDDTEDGDVMTIDKDGVVRRNGIVESQGE